ANNLVLNGIDDWISDVSIESVTLEFEYISAMNGNIVNITDVQLTGADAGNYEVSLVGAPSSSANISKRELTIDGSFTVADKVYDGLTSGSIVDNNLSLLNTIATDEVFLTNIFILFDNKDVADNKTANIVAVELAGDARFNYTLSLTGAPSTTANITPRELTTGGAFTAADKEYDGTNAATISEHSLTLITFISGDDVQLSNLVAEFISAEAGNDIAVNINTADLSGTDAGNYTLSLTGAPSTTANIMPKELTIGGDFTVADKGYDGTTTATIAENNLTLITTVAGDDVSLTNVVTEFYSEDAAENIVVNITTAELDGVDKENYSLSLAGAPTTTANIMPRELTIGGAFTAADKEYDGINATTISEHSLTLITFISGDDVQLSNLVAEFISAEAGNDIAVNINTADLSGTDAGNYTLSLTGAPSTTANIMPKELTIGGDFTVADKGYDGTTTATIAENNLTLITTVAGDDVSLTNVVAEFESADVGENITVSITAAELGGVDSGNYTLSLAGAPTTTATISAATSTFTVTFTVTDNSVPLEGATISINEQTLTTNIDGIATIELENGVYPYSVTASDYVAQEGSITVDGAPVNEGVPLVHVGVNTSLLSNIKVYPNPFQNTINITNASDVSRVVITNIVGKVVMTVKLSQASTPVIETNLPSGIYLVTIIANDGSKVTRKMIRE
ncbi:MAG: YDG domain-containing protein, partial [Bacteroidales bacterium]|nr:YDG domain-containing protein [Bacteroidales bacterium]